MTNELTFRPVDPGMPALPILQEPREPRAAPLQTTQWNWTNTPSWTNLLWTPIDFVATAFSWARARAAGDTEGQFDAGLRLAGMPFSILHALGAFCTFAFQLSYIIESPIVTQIKPILEIVRAPTLGLGVGLCLIEGIYESLCLRRTVQLLGHMQTSALHSLNEEIALHQDNPDLVAQKRTLLVQNLTYFREEYFEVSDEELRAITDLAVRNFPQNDDDQQAQIDEMTDALKQVKRANLDRRVRPWCGQKIARELAPLLQRLGEGDVAAAGEAERLLETIDAQGKKRLLIHIVGITALLVCAAGFILTMVACPVLVPFIMITASSILSTLNYLYGKGALDEQGWSFSFTKAVPPLGWIYNCLTPSSDHAPIIESVTPRLNPAT